LRFPFDGQARIELELKKQLYELLVKESVSSEATGECAELDRLEEQNFLNVSDRIGCLG
jgi:hypothetical protein